MPLCICACVSVWYATVCVRPCPPPSILLTPRKQRKAAQSAAHRLSGVGIACDGHHEQQQHHCAVGHRVWGGGGRTANCDHDGRPIDSDLAGKERWGRPPAHTLGKVRASSEGGWRLAGGGTAPVMVRLPRRAVRELQRVAMMCANRYGLAGQRVASAG